MEYSVNNIDDLYIGAVVKTVDGQVGTIVCLKSTEYINHEKNVKKLSIDWKFDPTDTRKKPHVFYINVLLYVHDTKNLMGYEFSHIKYILSKKHKKSFFKRLMSFFNI